jgi:hypothetical protein
VKRREFNRATFEVAGSIEMSDRATAEDRDLRAGKERSLGRIACSAFFWSLIVAGLFIVLAPMPGRADNDRDIHPGREDNEKGIRAEIAALHAQVASLQSTVSSLEGQVSALQKANTGQQNEIKNLQTSNTTLQNQLANAKNVLALDPFVSVDPNPEIGVIGPNIVFSGANIHIVSGSGATNDNFNFRGLGNLIIGYDEDPSAAVNAGAGVAPGPLPPLAPGDRGGSHNLVIGRWNRFGSAFGGFVAGEGNTIVGAGTSVSGGANTASGTDASVSGGRFNTAGGFYSSVSGGEGNTAAGFDPDFGFGASVSGGVGNTASGTDASVCGGEGNNAFDNASTVTGGTGNKAGSFVTFQEGIGASVLGGTGNNAGGRNSVVIGGQNITDNKDLSIAPQPPFP